MLFNRAPTCIRHGGWWIGWVEEFPGVNAQERTKPALLASLREILAEALEFNRLDLQEAEESSDSENSHPTEPPSRSQIELN